MGVFATLCQLCGLPVQHDHYVPSASGTLRIYRGAAPGGGHDWTVEGRQPFAFQPEHAWLMDAVGVPFESGEVVRGSVTDGRLAPTGSTSEAGGIFVGDGKEEALALHHACWELMGKPATAAQAITGRGTYGWAMVEPYQEQLFEFGEVVQDGQGALLVDPRGDSAEARASRARIEKTIEVARRCPREAMEPASVQEALSQDRDWRGRSIRAQSFERRFLVRYRSFGPVETKGYPELVCLVHEFPKRLRLEPSHVASLLDFEARFRSALESDGLGLAVLSNLGGGQAQYLAYVRDPAEAHRRLDALEPPACPGESDYDDAEDPEWKILFEEMGPMRR
ncbi:MAG: hypothetical protein QM765_46390 [Myxococcales bacterium]